MANILKGLKAIILERFSPLAYGPMIIVFTLVNGSYFIKAHANSGFIRSSFGIIVALAVMISAFLRLRLFDEIKDYDVDLKINPNRPLARGVISIEQVRVLISILILFEILVISIFVGLSALLIHIVALAFSMLMFEEFFIGRWIRPHLTTYAITHTFVSVLLGVSAAFLMSGQNQIIFSKEDFIFFLGNWFYFNLFEFARKSFSKDEERPGVDTYSSLFKPSGAGLLSLSQIIFGFLLWGKYLSANLKALSLVLVVVFILITIFYMLRTNKKTAGLFRGFAGLFLILQYLLTILNFWS